jgi:hypothetical protein
MNNISTTQIKINSCRTIQARQLNNRSKHWITIVRNKRKIWGSTYSGSCTSEAMELSVKKSTNGRVSALSRKLIRRHPCRSLDRQCRLKDTALSRSAAWQTKERQSRKWWCRKWVWVSLSKWFYDTFTGAATGAAHCGSFVGGVFGLLVASYGWTQWTRWFTWVGPPERNTLRPRKNWVVLCSSLPCLSLFCFSTDPHEEVFTRSFYSSRPGSYNETRGPTGGPEVVEALYNI